MTKPAKSAWGALLVELLPFLAALLAPLLVKIIRGPDAPPACACGGALRKLTIAGLVLLAWAAVVFANVFLFKLALRVL